MLLEQLHQKAEVSLRRLEYLQTNASKMYKTFTIPKRNGQRRTISQPTPELKAVQRWLVTTVFGRLPISECATAYMKGASIRKNAEAHAGSAFTLHMDFENFFLSFSKGNVARFLSDTTELTRADRDFCSAIVTRRGALTIGAPSSPAVTNALMHPFDVKMENWCTRRGLVYTRYADDINISSFAADSLGGAEDYIRSTARNFRYGRLRINSEKTAYLSRRYRRTITGVNLKPEGGVSIGRDRKREIRSFVHLFKSGSLPEELRWRVGGLIAFAADVEPSFVISLKRKYGPEVVEELLHQKPPRGLNPF